MELLIVYLVKTRIIVKVDYDLKRKSKSNLFILAMTCNQTSSFRCSSNSSCLTQDDLCNNITDCLHGEDEDEIICGHFCEWPSLNTCTSENLTKDKYLIGGFK
jgi:hypothetical protein